MAIRLNNRTRLTTQAEHLIAELGGYDPTASFDEQRLSDALEQAIDALARNRSPLLVKIYRQYEREGKVPALETLSTHAVPEQ